MGGRIDRPSTPPYYQLRNSIDRMTVQNITTNVFRVYGIQIVSNLTKVFG